MKEVRLMDSESDYKKLGINPNQIETWEDSRRSKDEKGTWEWWYFDGIMDDNTKIVIQFFTKSNKEDNIAVGTPNLAIKITLPDGTHYEEHPHFDANSAIYGKEMCDVNFDGNKFIGDLKNYEIHVNPVNGLGADLKIKSESKPYRPGTAFFECDDKYFTWFCAMPKGIADGTITVDGKERKVHGSCYHDHQWGTINLLQMWNHWLWSRQSFEDYSVMLFDMTSLEKYGGHRFPIIFIQDKEGNIIFEEHKNTKYELLETYKDSDSGKIYPKSCRYTFQNGAKTVIYQIEENTVLENRNMVKEIPKAKQLALKAMGLYPTYARYAGVASLSIKQERKPDIDRTGRLIYEFMYPSAKDFRIFK